MDADNLRKLAYLLRQEEKNLNRKKQEKLANLTLAAAGLELLRRKIYE